MSEWNRIKLNDCCNSIADGDHQPPPKAEKGIPFVTIANINSSNQFDFKNTHFVPREYYDKLDDKRRPEKDDVLYSVVGSFGIPVFMKEQEEFVFQRHIAILRPKSEIIWPRFLYYSMLTKEFYAQADAAAIGAAQRTVSLGALRNMAIAIPSMDEQIKISDILSAYDDLIETNQRQIKLLEEAAQRLYKEWFVDLRFPGHENVPVVDGVPKGWEKSYLGIVSPIVTGKKDANFGTTDGKYAFFTCAQEPIKAPSYSYNCDAVILAGNGDFNVKLYRGQFEAYQRTYVFSPYNYKHLYLLYHSIRENMRQLSTGASGSTIKFLTKSMLESIKVLIPDKETLSVFNRSCDTIQQKKECLSKQIAEAKEARERLLPKMMSGEIEV